MDGTTARRLLGVAEHATIDDVHRAFRRAVFGAHPDAGGDAATFRALLTARDLLASIAPAARADHAGGGRFRAAWATPPTGALDVVDIVRAPVRGATQPAPTGPSFADVLAEALAA